jgi:hypothetical protein
MIKKSILKWFLIVSAIGQIVYWSLSHLFFPAWYLRSVGMTILADDPGQSLIFIHEIGVLTFGMGIATLLAAFNPVKNIAIIITLYVVSLGSIAVSAYHIVFNNTASGEWMTIAVISAQLIIVTILYPWKELRRLNAE